MSRYEACVMEIQLNHIHPCDDDDDESGWSDGGGGPLSGRNPVISMRALVVPGSGGLYRIIRTMPVGSRKGTERQSNHRPAPPMILKRKAVYQWVVQLVLPYPSIKSAQSNR